MKKTLKNTGIGDIRGSHHPQGQDLNFIGQSTAVAHSVAEKPHFKSALWNLPFKVPGKAVDGEASHQKYSTTKLPERESGENCRALLAAVQCRSQMPKAGCAVGAYQVAVAGPGSRTLLLQCLSSALY